MRQGYVALTSGLALKLPGATEVQIAELLEESGVKFPSAYLDLLRYSNGVEGLVDSESYIILFRIDDLVEYNIGYGFPESAPGLFMFATDGGDTAYAFDTSSPKMPIVGISLSSLTDDPVRLAGSLPEFLYGLAGIQRKW